MKQKLCSLLLFAVGGGIGFAAARQWLKQKYDRLAQEEIDSVKAAFRTAQQKGETETNGKPEKQPREEGGEKAQEERKAYTGLLTKLGYAEDAALPPEQTPHVIAPDEYGEQDGYDEISLTYYTDGTLTDDADRPMDEVEIEQTIGRESLEHFGEYEDDSVFVRNDRLKADYEILLDQRAYAEVLREKPYLAK